MAFPEHLETARLSLDRWDPARDGEQYASICADHEVMRFLGGPAEPAAAHAHAREIAADWETHGYGVWAARERPTVVRGAAGAAPGPLLGYVGLAGADWLPGWEHAVEVGWRLARTAWGRGYATEGALAAVDAGRRSLGLREVHSFIDPANAASVRVAEKLGLTPIAGTSHPRRAQELTVYHRVL